MQQQPTSSTKPDIIAELQRARKNIVHTIYHDDHFHLEFQWLISERNFQIYKLYIQGYLGVTTQGFDLAKHFFHRVGINIDNENVEPSHFFINDPLKWEKPASIPQALHSDVLFPHTADLEVWEKFFTHPLYDCAFKFRFLVASCDDRGYEHRHDDLFAHVDHARQRAAYSYREHLQNTPDLFVRKNFYDPELSEDEIQLLSQIQW
jgi:hypothetical protein